MNFDNAVFEASAALPEQLLPSDLPEIVFSGRSNVGKSSLINKLLNRKDLARVSSTPGKTITINFYKLKGARFVDLPGYGYAKRSSAEIKRWSELIEGYFRQERKIALVIQLIDVRHSPSEHDFMMVDFLNGTDLPYIIVFTKCDKVKKTELKDRIVTITEELKHARVVEKIAISALKGEGIDVLRSYINKAVEKIDG